MSSLIENLAKHLPKPPVAPKPKAYYGDYDIPAFYGHRRERIALPRRNINVNDFDFTSADDLKLIKPTILNVWSNSHPLEPKPDTKDVPMGTVWHDEWEGVLRVRTESGWLQLL